MKILVILEQKRHNDADSKSLKRLQHTITATLYFFMLNVVTAGRVFLVWLGLEK